MFKHVPGLFVLGNSWNLLSLKHTHISNVSSNVRDVQQPKLRHKEMIDAECQP